MTKEEDYVRAQVIKYARFLPRDTFRSLLCRELEVRFTPRWKVLNVSVKFNRCDGWHRKWGLTRLGEGVT